MNELAILARGGVLLTVWALAAGWPRGRLTGRLRRDGWQRICRRAWAVPGKEVDWRVRATALQLLRPDLVCSHRTAARLHRIELLGDAHRGGEDLVFTTSRAGAIRRDGGRLRIHSTSHLTDRDWSTRRGLRTTTPARTVADLIRSCRSREEAVVTADSALARRAVDGVRREPLVRYEELAAELAGPRPGARRARTWLPLTEPASGSPAETVARLRMADAGLFPNRSHRSARGADSSCARTSCSARRAWPSRSRATPSTAPAGPTNGTSPATTPCSPARRSAACCASRPARSSPTRTA